jgi:GntR family transcriptional repressor for pyruvate dehydrogenase complex
MLSALRTPIEPLATPERLSDRVADQLARRIDSGELGPEQRLPTEQQLSERFGVSRNVVREAVSRLKSMGLLVSRQGAGVFVAPRGQARALAFDPSVLQSLDSVVQVVEVRRALEGEVAALAAQRITPAKARTLRAALDRLEAAVAAGADGVEEDLAFHRSIAQATDNPQFERLLAFLEQYQRDAMRVTRTNEAMHGAFMRAVHREHEAIVRAVTAGDAQAARRAAVRHMVNAAVRIEGLDAPARRTLEGLLVPASH